MQRVWQRVQGLVCGLSSRIAFRVGLVLAVAVGLVATVQPANGSSSLDKPEKRVIVLLSGAPALVPAGPVAGGKDESVSPETASRVVARRHQLRAVHDRVVDVAHAAGVETHHRRDLTRLVNAIALNVPASDVDKLRNLPGVAGVVPDERIRTATASNLSLIGAPEVWERADPDGAPVRGVGTTVAVVGTGVDYTHPALGSGFGPGHKVVGGYDFVNDDRDPMDDNGHGTHVAGIIAGDGDKVTGVAPAAQLTAYKVLDQEGSGWMSDVIAGLGASVSLDNPHRADVVNLSVSGPGDGNGPLGKAATAAAELGAVVVVAAGNSGPGESTVHGAAAAAEVLSVGASISGVRMPTATMLAPKRVRLQTFRAPYSANPPAEPVVGRLVDVGEGRPEDYERVGDVTGKVVAIHTSIPRHAKNVLPYLIDQARSVEQRGAIAMLAYTTNTGPVLAPQRLAWSGPALRREAGVTTVPMSASGDDFRMDKLVVLGLRELQWAGIERRLENGLVKVEISGTDVTDQVASFSSRGPAPDFGLGPDLVAPGVEIVSAWPKAWWDPGVRRLSGTSMAAGHVAGSAALLRQLYPDASASEIRGRLVGATAPVEAGPTTAGSGRLDVAAAASTPVTAAPTSISLGLADLSGEQVHAGDTVVLHNHSAEPIDVSLSTKHFGEPAGVVTVSPHAGTIPAGGDLEVHVELTASRPDRDVELSGWVVAEVEGTVDERLRIPYLLTVQHLMVRTSPDPSYGDSEVFVWSPVTLKAAPVLRVSPPHRPPYTVAMHHDHGLWWRASLRGRHGGSYTLTASAASTTGTKLRGRSAFEIVGDSNSFGSRRRWEPIGPNGTSGDINTTPADPETAVVTQYRKSAPWITRDGGDSWRQLNRLPVAAGTGDLVISADNQRTMWYAVNGSTGGAFDQLLDPTYRGRILRTHDGGRHWEALDVPNVHYLALISDKTTQVLVAVSAESLMMSIDGGDTWSAYPNPVGADFVGAAVSGRDVFLAARSGVWVVRGLGIGEPTASEQVYDAGEGHVDGFVGDDALVAVLTGEDRIVGSRDGGSTWELVYDVPKGSHWTAGVVDIMMRAGDIAVMTYWEDNFLGRDHGRSWTRVPEPVPGAIESDFAQWGGDDLLWSSGQAGLFRTDGEGGAPSRIGVQGLTVYDLAVTESRGGTQQLLAGTISGVYSTELPTRYRLGDRVGEWGLSGYEAHSGAVVGQIAVSPRDPHVVWKIRKDALDDFWVYRSAAGGGKWQLRGRTGETPMDIMVSPHDPNRVVVPFWSLPGSGLYVTRDGGDTWKKLFHEQVFTVVVADPDRPGLLWLGSDSGLYRSDDFGATVHKVVPGSVTAIGVDGSRIVIGGKTLRVSDNHGKTFRVADSGGLPMRVADITTSPTDPGTWYAATTSFKANGLVKGGRGVLRSTDGGRTWENVSAGLPSLSVAALATSPDGRWLYAGAVNGGVYRLRTK